MEKEKKEVYVAPDFVVYEMEYEGALLSGSTGGASNENPGREDLEEWSLDPISARNKEIGWD